MQTFANLFMWPIEGRLHATKARPAHNAHSYCAKKICIASASGILQIDPSRGANQSERGRRGPSKSFCTSLKPLMKLIKNSSNDRVLDALRKALAPQSSLDIASPAFSLFAFAEVQTLLEKLDHCRLVLPTTEGTNLNLLGSEADRPFRNRLQVRWLARQCVEWIKKKTELRRAPAVLPQSTLIANHEDSARCRVLTGKETASGKGLYLSSRPKAY
jgi:hypothetical protein